MITFIAVFTCILLYLMVGCTLYIIIFKAYNISKKFCTFDITIFGIFEDRYAIYPLFVSFIIFWPFALIIFICELIFKIIFGSLFRLVNRILNNSKRGG